MEQKQKTTRSKTEKLHAVGRRKTAKCTVNIVRGNGNVTVNGKKLEEYFTQTSQKAVILLPFVETQTLGDFDVTAKVSGGGMEGQTDALMLAIARSLAKMDEGYHAILSKKSLLTRDPRAKERKKIFFVRARKKPQFSKR